MKTSSLSSAILVFWLVGVGVVGADPAIVVRNSGNDCIVLGWDNGAGLTPMFIPIRKLVSRTVEVAVSSTI